MYGGTELAGTTTAENKKMYGGPGLAVNTATENKKMHGRTIGDRGENGNTEEGRNAKSTKKIQQVKATQTEAQTKDKEKQEINSVPRPAEEEKNEAVAIDMYKTVRVAKPTEDSKAEGTERPKKEEQKDQEPEKVGIMIILNNPKREKEEIDESEEDMYFRFQQMIEEDIAERERLGQELDKERERPIVVCRCRSNYQKGLENRCHNTISVDRQTQRLGDRIRRVQDKARREKHNAPVQFDSVESVSWENYKKGDEATKRVRLIQQGECPYMKITLLGHEFDALMDSGAGLSLISRASVERLIQSSEWEHCKEGRPLYKTDEIVSAVNCDGRP